MLYQLLYIVAWAAVAFAIIYSLMIAFRFHRKLARATAFAVAGAFALGAVSPIALPSRSGSAAPLPVTETSHVVSCPPNAVISAKPAMGHIDSAFAGNAAGSAAPPTLVVVANAVFHVGGWLALDTGLPAQVCAIVDNHVASAVVNYGIARADVAAALGKPAAAASGFALTLAVSQGTHTLDIGAVDPDGRTVHPISSSILKVLAQ